VAAVFAEMAGSLGGLLVAAAAALLALMSLLVLIYRQNRILASIPFDEKRLLQEQPKEATQIAGWSEGVWGKLSGRVSFSGEPLRAPLSARPCVAYRLVVEQRVAGAWKAIWSHDAGTQFRITDATGSALIRGYSPSSRVLLDRTAVSRDARSALARAGFRRGIDRRRQLRYREGILTQGESAVVFGHGHWELARRGEGREVELTVGTGNPRSVILCDAPSVGGAAADTRVPKRFGRVFRRIESAS